MLADIRLFPERGSMDRYLRPFRVASLRY